jgi:hypothetical protein
MTGDHTVCSEANVAARFLAVVAVLLLFAPGPAVPRDAAPETVVSTEICSRLWIVELVWSPEGREPRDLVAVFDTGGSRAFVDPDALERISGERIKAGKQVRLEDMSVAGRPFHKFRPQVRDLDHISRALGRRLDVFLPFQTFAGYLLVLDYPAGEMRIIKGALSKPDGVTVFDARGRDKRPWLNVTVGPLERRLLIDSGSSGSITVKPHRKLSWVSDPVPLRLFQGMTDVELMKVGRLDGLARIGPLAFPEPLIALTHDIELLGAQVLKHFVLTFDQKHRRVRLEPVATEPVGAESYRGTGAVLRPRKENFEIAHVIAGSPADQAGLEKGDRVTHLDGVPVMERGCRDFERDVQDMTTISVLRRGERHDFEVGNVVLVP